MDNELTVYQDWDRQAVIDLALDSVTSEHSRRAYKRALEAFLDWLATQDRPLSKALVNQYRSKLLEQDLSPATINQQLAAVKTLAREASDNQLLAEHVANGIKAVRGIKREGVRTGNWLTQEQAAQLINAPDESVKGLRDRALLGLMIGAGLRRAEIAALTFDHIQQREGRWCIVDLIGKGQRIRSIPIPGWAKSYVDKWAEAAGVTGGCVFRPLTKSGRVCGERIDPHTVNGIVRLYAKPLGLAVAAHDLRRSYAKLSFAGGAGLDQIQLTLGHASIETTQRYLGMALDLHNAPCDHLQLEGLD